MGLLDTTKEVAKIAAALANPDLIQMAMKANIEALELSEKNLELQKKIVEFEKQLAEATAKQNLEGHVTRENGLVFLDGDGEPCCSHCWDVKRVLVHIVYPAMKIPECPACKTSYPRARPRTTATER